MNQPTHQEIWQSILTNLKSTQGELQPGEKTIKMVMKETGMGRDKTRALLLGLVDHGVLQMQMRYVPSVHSRVAVFAPKLGQQLEDKG